MHYVWTSWHNYLCSPRSTTRHSSRCPMKIWKKLVSLPLEPDARCCSQSQVRNRWPAAQSLQLLVHVCVTYWNSSHSDPDLNKSRRRLSDSPAVKPSFLEGGASGRLLQVMDADAAAQSNHWWGETPVSSELHQRSSVNYTLMLLSAIFIYQKWKKESTKVEQR